MARSAERMARSARRTARSAWAPESGLYAPCALRSALCALRSALCASRPAARLPRIPVLAFVRYLADRGPHGLDVRVAEEHVGEAMVAELGTAETVIVARIPRANDVGPE